MGENPYQPSEAEVIEAEIVDDRANGNVIADTVIGLNLRWRDNLFQAIAILVFAGIGAAVGAVMVDERIGGGILGGFAGTVVGFFASGLFLMIYRAVKHVRG